MGTANRSKMVFFVWLGCPLTLFAEHRLKGQFTKFGRSL